MGTIGKFPDHTIKENIGHESRGMTMVKIGDLGVYNEETELPLADTITLLQALLEGIPEEYKDSAVLRITVSGRCASASSSVTFLRPETDEELADRRRWLQAVKEDRERALREYQRLKAKYESEHRQ